MRLNLSGKPRRLKSILNSRKTPMFKRTVLSAVCLFFAACYCAQAWTIEDYKISIKLEKDSSLDVTEVIEADFGYESKHGIFRDIPIVYNDEQGRVYNIRFDVLGVSNKNQQTWPYREENLGNFKRLKIGSPNETLSGRQTYVITYRVSGGILFLGDHDELYWNAVGPQWDVPINHVQVSVQLPEPVAKESIKTTSYTGVQGSKTSNARVEVVNEEQILFEGGQYQPHEGFTVVVGVPKGILTQPPAPAYVSSPRPVDVTDRPSGQTNSYGERMLGSLVMLVPVIVFYVMWSIWRLFGKDPETAKSIMVEYKAPDDLKPAEMGTLIDGKVDQRDITSTIIDLAIRGYIKIVQQKRLLWEKDYSLVKLKSFEDDRTLKLFELVILRSLFGGGNGVSEVKMSELQYHFYQKVYAIEDALKDELKSRKFIGDEREGLVGFYLVIGGMMFFLGIVSVVFDVWVMAALILSAVIICLFGLIMPKRTIEGAKNYSRILGFKEFLQRTDKEKIQKAEQQDIFEKMLPYAICLGMSTVWAKKFNGLYVQPPQWFAGDYSGVFLYNHFIHDLDRSINTMGNTFYSSPQTVSSSGGFSGGGFSGGGSSGGGFGGGGGGSW